MMSVSEKEKENAFMDIRTFTREVRQYALDMGTDLVCIAPLSRYEGAPCMLQSQAHQS